MPEEDEFIIHLNAKLALAIQYKQTSLSLIKRAETEGNKAAIIAAQAGAYRAGEAESSIKQALEIRPPTKMALELSQTGSDHLDRSERQLARASDLLAHE